MSSLILWNVAWSVVLAVIVFGLGFMPSLRRRPALMHLLWFGVLLRLIVPAVVAVPVLPVAEAAAPVEAEVADVLPRNISVEVVPLKPLPTTAEPARSESDSWTDSVDATAILWSVSLLGTGVFLAVSLWRGGSLIRLTRRAEEAPCSLAELTQQLAGELKLARVPRVRVVAGLASPSVWGVGQRATILLPRHLVDSLDADQWSCIVAHELAHLVRGDFWFNLVAAGVLHLFW